MVRGQTLPPEWWLDESGCLKGGDLCPTLASRTLALRTPRGFKLSSRGQGHALGARRPRIKPLKGTDPEGATRWPLQGRETLKGTRTVGSTHGYSCCSAPGSTEQSKLFGSHWSNQWLAQKRRCFDRGTYRKRRE